MDDSIGESDSMNNCSGMTTRVIRDAVRHFGPDVDRHSVERLATKAVADLWTEPVRVKTFIPVLAMREIRDMLKGDGLALAAGNVHRG